MARIAVNIEHYYIDPDKLDLAARDLEKAVQEIEESRRRLTKAKDQVGAAWKSRYTSRYLQSMDLVGNRIQRTATTVRSIASRLRTAAADVRRVEAEIQRAMKNGGGSSGGGFR